LQTRFGQWDNSLYVATCTRNAEMVKLLIKHGADIYAVAHDGFTPVPYAALSGHCGILQMLLDAGAKLSAQAQYNAVDDICNQLDDATLVQVLKVLLPHCSNFADSNYHLGCEMLASAVSNGKLQAARALLAAGAYVHWMDVDGTLMHYAAKSGSIAAVKWLQSLGLDARAVAGMQLRLPLHWASEHKHVHLVEHFLALPGAADDVHAQASHMLTALHVAATSGADSVVQLLLQRGAVVEARTCISCTPLMLASSLPVAKLLLNAGADAAAADNRGLTVLMYQAQRGACASTVCLLLKAGADPTVTASKEGISLTAASLAGINGHFAIEALLSRAAEDYAKKHPAVSSTPDTSSSRGSSSDTSGSSSSSSAD
jgi:ankyrin repeat protein